MTQEEYIKDRVVNQIEWYGDKSSMCQKKYKIWQVLKVISALLITTLSLWSDKDFFYLKDIKTSYVVAILGAFIVFIESFLKIYDYKKLWVQYRMASENLNREKLFFETKSEPYDGPEPFKLFVQNCEAIMKGENQGWEDILAEEDNA